MTLFYHFFDKNLKLFMNFTDIFARLGGKEGVFAFDRRKKRKKGKKNSIGISKIFWLDN